MPPTISATDVFQTAIRERVVIESPIPQQNLLERVIGNDYGYEKVLLARSTRFAMRAMGSSASLHPEAASTFVQLDRVQRFRRGNPIGWKLR